MQIDIIVAHFSACIRIVLYCFVVIYQFTSCFILVCALAGYHNILLVYPQTTCYFATACH